MSFGNPLAILRNCVSFETQYPWKETNVECRHDEEVFHRVMVGKQFKVKIFVSWALAQPANCFSTTDVRIRIPFGFIMSCSVHLRNRLHSISICRPSIAACSVYRRTLCVQPRSRSKDPNLSARQRTIRPPLHTSVHDFQAVRH